MLWTIFGETIVRKLLSVSDLFPRYKEKPRRVRTVRGHEDIDQSLTRRRPVTSQGIAIRSSFAWLVWCVKCANRSSSCFRKPKALLSSWPSRNLLYSAPAFAIAGFCSIAVPSTCSSLSDHHSGQSRQRPASTQKISSGAPVCKILNLSRRLDCASWLIPSQFSIVCATLGLNQSSAFSHIRKKLFPVSSSSSSPRMDAALLAWTTFSIREMRRRKLNLIQFLQEGLRRRCLVTMIHCTQKRPDIIP
jgi:hypothetical protein